MWSLTSSLQSTSLPLCLSYNRRDPVAQIQDWHTSSANGGLRTKEPSRWFVPASAMESAVNSGVRNALLSIITIHYVSPLILLRVAGGGTSVFLIIESSHEVAWLGWWHHVVSSWSQLYHPFLSSRRWTGSSVWRQLWRSALRVSICLQGEDLPLLHLRWAQRWAALVLHLLWLWDGPEIFFLYREEWWAHVLLII